MTADPLGRRRRAFRMLPVGVVLVLLIFGSTVGTRFDFPFGPFNMYAGRYPVNGTITSNSMMARTAAGHEVSVPQSVDGLSRADVEGQLPKFVADPGLLGNVATEYNSAHPDASPYVSVWIAQIRWQLHDRAVVSHRVVTVAQWPSP